MADRRRGKQKRRDDEPDKPTKEEYAVAKHLRFNLPAREGKLVGMTVQYFIASKAIDALLESKWSSGSKNSETAFFNSRAACVDYMDRLLQKGMFHRAARIEKKKDASKKKKKPKESDKEESGKEEEKKKKDKKGKKGREKEKEVEDKDTEEKENVEEVEKEEKKEPEKKEEEKKDEEKKRKKKARLEMHETQVFKDGDEVYVWIYDPVPVKTFIIGLLLVLGAIAVCLFPLWPPEVRLGVYYLSLAAAGFVGVILALCVVRLILFCLVWGCTMGKHHFWFLPNLTEDVGFIDSFRPLYKHDSFDTPTDEELEKEKEKKEISKTVDSSDKKEVKDKEKGSPQVAGEKDNNKGKKAKKETEGKKETEKKDEEKTEEEELSVSGSGSEIDHDNGYEMIEREDLEDEENDELEDDEEDSEGEEDETETKKDK